jgi:hypothetical protein
MSDWRESSATLHFAKNSGVTRFVVASSATCFAPFSQNSKCVRSPSGSGHAQPGQSKPPFWLMRVSVRSVRAAPISAHECFNADTMAGKPPAVSLAGEILIS